jgi:hypothetical protein
VVLVWFKQTKFISQSKHLWWSTIVELLNRGNAAHLIRVVNRAEKNTKKNNVSET